MDIELENEIQKRLHKYHKKMWASYGAIAIDILFLIYMGIFKLDLDICFIWNIWNFSDICGCFCSICRNCCSGMSVGSIWKTGNREDFI